MAQLPGVRVYGSCFHQDSHNGGSSPNREEGLINTQKKKIKMGNSVLKIFDIGNFYYHKLNNENHVIILYSHKEVDKIITHSWLKIKIEQNKAKTPKQE